jgi:hypothetical protein
MYRILREALGGTPVRSHFLMDSNGSDLIFATREEAEGRGRELPQLVSDASARRAWYRYSVVEE